METGRPRPNAANALELRLAETVIRRRLRHGTVVLAVAREQSWFPRELATDTIGAREEQTTGVYRPKALKCDCASNELSQAWKLSLHPISM